MSAADDLPPLDTLEARSAAQSASLLGTLSVILCLMAPCASCMPLVFALPLSLWTTFQARRVLAATTDEVAMAYARGALANGVVSLVYSSLMLLLVLTYIGLYVAMIAFALIAAGTSGP